MVETLIFLIIVGILSTIFGKGKVRNRSKGRSFSPNGFEEFKTLIQKQMEHPSLTTVQHELSKPFEKMEETIEEKYLQVKEIRVKENELIHTVPAQSVPVLDHQKQMVQDEKYKISDDSNAILNGLIWSEILGEPRSRNPHFPRK
jgi:hypothetical protein